MPPTCGTPNLDLEKGDESSNNNNLRPQKYSESKKNATPDLGVNVEDAHNVLSLQADNDLGSNNST